MSNIFLKIVARDFGQLAGMISWGWYKVASLFLSPIISLDEVTNMLFSMYWRALATGFIFVVLKSKY